jgi:AraC-like DNA-binding protein
MISDSVSSATNAGIPHDIFDTHGLSPDERFEVWRESVLPLFEPQLDDDTSHEFYARLDGFHLRRALISLAEFSAQRYERALNHRPAEQVDHLLIQLYLTGGYVGENGGRAMRVGPGDISCLDLGASLSTAADNSSAVSLVVPREAMFSLVPPDRINVGEVIAADSAVGRILGHQLTSAWRALRSASADEAEQICQMLLGAVTGAFARDARDFFGDTMSDQDLLDAVRAYIERNLASRQLTPELLCRRFACSRARLYRLFRPLGGVAAYIRQARLERCMCELSDPYRRDCSVSTVAARWGFTNQRLFERLFRERFGMTPTEARARAHAAADWPSTAAQSPTRLPTFADWLRWL